MSNNRRQARTSGTVAEAQEVITSTLVQSPRCSSTIMDTARDAVQSAHSPSCHSYGGMTPGFFNPPSARSTPGQYPQTHHAQPSSRSHHSHVAGSPVFARPLTNEQIDESSGCHPPSPPSSALVPRSGLPVHHAASMPPQAGHHVQFSPHSMQLSNAASFPDMSKLHAKSEEDNRFHADLLFVAGIAEPDDKYKAFIRLFNYLRRQQRELRVSVREAPAAWMGRPDAGALLHKMFQVGDQLARFGTTDFKNQTTNSSRAILATDYKGLLSQYLDACGPVYRDEVMERMDRDRQDYALALKLLLVARCETNNVIMEKYLDRVGMESKAASQHPVVVTNVTTALTRADNQVTHNPHIQAGAHALAQAKQIAQGASWKLLAGLAGAFLLKAPLLAVLGHVPLVGAVVGRRRGRRGEDAMAIVPYEGEFDAGGRRRGGPRAAVFDAVGRVDDCRKEFEKAQRNTRRAQDEGFNLLGIRVVTPVHRLNTDYESVDFSRCDTGEAIKSMMRYE